VRRVTTAAVVAVAAVALVASYDHQRQLASLAGEGWRAWLLPLSAPPPSSASVRATAGRAGPRR
jgi:putative SOS response-associated peptidase YedK